MNENIGVGVFLNLYYMIFSNPTESTSYSMYILDFPIWKDAVWSINITKDGIEDILSDLLILQDWESIYIKRDWDRYVCNIEWKTWHGFCVKSIGEALIKLLKWLQQ